MDQYHVVNFIRKNPPRSKDPVELTIWFRSITKIFKNNMPTSVVHVLKDMNIPTIDECILDYWTKKSDQEARVVNRYDEYIERREQGNDKAQQERLLEHSNQS